MDAEKLSVFDNEYFAINKRLQTASGLWPYAPLFGKIVKRIIISIILFFLAAPHVIAIKMWCGKDLGLCGENIAGLLYASGVIAKFSTTIICEKQITNVYKLLAENWLSIKDPEEREILLRYAGVGKFIGVTYVAYIIAAGFAFSQFSMLNTVLDVVMPLNESRPKMLVVRGEYLVDPYEYYFELYLAYCVFAVVSLAVFLGVDTSYVAVVHQSLANFSIVQHRLHKATAYYRESKSLGYNTIVSAIRMHKDALQFIDVIENSYGPCLLYLVSMTVVFLSVGAIVILEVMDQTVEALRFTMFELGVVFHLFYVSWPGQKVMDHSTELFLHTYTCQWYEINERGKTLIKIMMLRCLKPTLLTAMGFYNMSFENFATMIKSTMSYITVAMSFRE